MAIYTKLMYICMYVQEDTTFRVHTMMTKTKTSPKPEAVHEKSPAPRVIYPLIMSTNLLK